MRLLEKKCADKIESTVEERVETSTCYALLLPSLRCCRGRFLVYYCYSVMFSYNKKRKDSYPTR
ncbi:Hypothetical protein, putative [Bodo saltans]|uniref:Uncharacterized protein n=1 Tax=Bodo saltans TaxID=75058 RepID=A0A0S4ITT5_BODSA|nr:Hypothetical protein, putative [Bodo saltans]|eukprot:CUF91571.1 Hypothetical protein, putative [Bodo saltans]